MGQTGSCTVGIRYLGPILLNHLFMIPPTTIRISKIDKTEYSE